MREEEWRAVPGYEDYYEVSNLGRVKSLSRYIDSSKLGTPYKKHVRERILRQIQDKDGYMHVHLSGKTKKVHRLVALSFLLNPKNKRCINHIDCNKKNNSLKNLEWCTHSENMLHAVKNGFESYHKLNKEQVLKIRQEAKYKSTKILGAKYGVDRKTIYNILSGFTWSKI